MSSQPPFRIIVVTGPDISSWQQGCVSALLEDAGACLEAVLVVSQKGNRLPGLYSGIFPLTPVEDAFPDASPVPFPDGASAAGRHACDAVLNLTNAPLPDPSAIASKHGVWAFLLGKESPPACPCLWETLRGRDMIEGVLYTEDGAAGPGRALWEFRIRNRQGALAKNVRAMARAAEHAPKRVCLEIRSGGSPSSYAAEVHIPATTIPRRAALRCQWRRLAGRAAGVWSRLFEEDWDIGLVQKPIDSFLAPSEWTATWLFPGTGTHFRADPFGLPESGGLRIFYEKYAFKDRIGRLAQARVDNLEARELPEAPLEADFHLSYPFLVQEGETVFALPESRQSGRLNLYEVDTRTGRFHSPKCLLEEAVSDATIFRFNDLWWLFALKTNFELHAWHADSLEGPWQPHMLNPLKIDPASARPGGTPFLHKGTLYRPAQDCSRVYGGAVALCRVLELTTTSFREDVVGTISPRSPYPHGLHTLAAVGDMTIIDGKRLRFAPVRALWNHMKKRWA